jgi:hypothetical protein
MDIVVVRGSVTLSFVARPGTEEDLPGLEWIGLTGPERDQPCRVVEGETGQRIA